MHRLMRLAAIVTLGATLLLGGCQRYEKIDTVDRAMPPNVQHLSEDQIHDAIVHAASKLDWSITPVAPGHLEATQNSGQLSATVYINYAPDRLQIVLKSSTNLFQTATTVHGRYNRWVRSLEKEITDELAATP